MTTWYVGAGSGTGDGSSTSPFSTLAAAEKAARPGDAVIVAPGIYREKLTFATPNVAWVSAEKHQAILDGGYGWKLGKTRGLMAAPTMPKPGPSHLPGGQDAETRGYMINIQAPDAVLDGFCLQNLAGGAVTIQEHRATIIRCAFYAIYGTAIHSNTTGKLIVTGCRIEDCDIVWASLRTFALGGREASGALKMGNCGGNVIRNVRVWLNGGEGFNIGKRTGGTADDPFIVEACTLMDIDHTCLYANQAQNVVFRDNAVVYHENVNPFLGAENKAGGAAGLRLKDEDSPSPVSSRNVRFERNVVVNARLLFEAGGDDVTQHNCAAVGNTLVSGPYTQKGISLISGANNQGTQVDIRDNLIHWGRTLPNAVGIGTGAKTRCTFGHNAWSQLPPTSHRGDGDYYGDTALANPDAPVLATGEAFCDSWADWQARGLRSSFDLDNYRPRTGGLMDGSGYGALEALPEIPDDPKPPDPPEVPEPPEPDPDPPSPPDPPLPAPKWREGLEQRERGLLANCETYSASAPAGLPGHNVFLLVAKLASLLDEGA